MKASDIEWKNPPPHVPGEPEHLNCFTQVLTAHAEVLGKTPEEAKALGTHFGGGMRYGGACGPTVAALLLLGALYGDAPEEQDRGKAFLTEFCDRFGGLTCAELQDPERARCDAAIRWTREYIAARRSELGR